VGKDAYKIDSKAFVFFLLIPRIISRAAWEFCFLLPGGQERSLNPMKMKDKIHFFALR